MNNGAILYQHLLIIEYNNDINIKPESITTIRIIIIITNNY